MTTAALPSTIQASIHPDALDKVSRFFNATPEHTLHELFQNARRAHATRVDVTIANGVVSVTDDGDGIADPSSLLAFGHSDWNPETQRREDPAGMGIYALANSAATIISNTRDPAVPAWRVSLTPEHFLGQSPTAVRQLRNQTALHGTTVSFASKQAHAHQVKFVARYYPLPVTCNGVLMERRDFLEKAIHVVEWRGLRIGVYSNTGRRDDWYHDRSVNFHGVLALDPKLPWVPTMHGAWGVRIDIVDCPNIKLVLPARREVVRDAFVDDLRGACRRIIYETMLAQETPPDLPYQEYAAAHALGVPYPTPQPQLRPWRPKARHASFNDEQTPNLPASVNPDTAVVIKPGTIDTSDNFTLARAAAQHDFQDRLWSADYRYEGYPWYDNLAFATRLQIIATSNDAPQDITETCRLDTKHSYEERPDRIDFILSATRSRDSADSGQSKLIGMSSDVAFAAGEYWDLEDCQPLVTKDSAIAPAELTELMIKSFFDPSEDEEADSIATQEEDFRDAISKAVIALLESEEAATLEAIRQAAQRYVRYLLPPGNQVDIRIRPGTPVTVTLSAADA